MGSEEEKGVTAKCGSVANGLNHCSGEGWQPIDMNERRLIIVAY